MTVVAFRKPALAIGCSSCGATVDAACDCGAPYMPAGQRAAAAVAANPQMSDRAIAREIGVSTPTVSRARATVTDVTVDDERVGLDGKVRRMPRRVEDDDDGEEVQSSPDRKRVAFLVFSNEAMLLAKYDGPVDAEIIEAAKATASAWSRLVKTMEKGNG